MPRLDSNPGRAVLLLWTEYALVLKFASQLRPATCTSFVLILLLVFDPRFVGEVKAQQQSVPVETAPVNTEVFLPASDSVSRLFTPRPLQPAKVANPERTFIPSIRALNWSDSRFVFEVAMRQGTTSTASTAPGQSNSGVQKKSGKLKWILIAVAGGAAVGVFAATRKSDEDSQSQVPGPTTVTVGTPTIGSPQ